MNASSPHYLLFAESHIPAGPSHRARWRFVLESLDGRERLEAADEEPDAAGRRLELLAVVRGLEALDQPSRVTLVTTSSYVSRGLRFGLDQWRENDWMWERFGKMTPVKDGDLWRRVDQALRYHQVECRMWRFAAPVEGAASEAKPAVPGEPLPATSPSPASSSPPTRRRLRPAGAALNRVWPALRQGWASVLGRLAPPLTA